MEALARWLTIVLAASYTLGLVSIRALLQESRPDAAQESRPATVDDAAARTLMVDFYRRWLGGGTTRIAALCDAKRQAIKAAFR